MGKMADYRYLLVFLVVLPTRSTVAFGCSGNELVLYRLIFETYWSKENFPKQYPENRPPAHWSRLIGMTHDDNYVLFRMGETASNEFKVFAETGKTYLFGRTKESHVFDQFSTSSIKNGTGKAKVNFFVDGNHSMVSLAAKIVPSPDWFVGIDSLSLCSGGTWLDSILIEASPLDAGTDNGYTFTAPNWNTEPQEIITKITSKYPKHPANSFYYPKLKDLPVIATFRLLKMKSYRLDKGRGQRSDDDDNVTTSPGDKKSVSTKNDTAAGKLVKYKRFYKRKLKKSYKKSDAFG